MAKDTFGGRLTPDFIAEKLGHSSFLDVRELDLPNCAIRTVDLGTGEQFINLRRSVSFKKKEIQQKQFCGGFFNQIVYKLYYFNKK